MAHKHYTIAQYCIVLVVINRINASSEISCRPPFVNNFEAVRSMIHGGLKARVFLPNVGDEPFNKILFRVNIYQSLGEVLHQNASCFISRLKIEGSWLRFGSDFLQ